jgi:hypothetical protein
VTIHRLAFGFAVAALVSFASPAMASTSGRVSAQSYAPSSAATYSRNVELSMQSSYARIQRSVSSARITAATRDRILYDVRYGMHLIRTRVARAAADGIVTAFERSQVNALEFSIQRDLTNRYGGIDSWNLL